MIVGFIIYIASAVYACAMSEIYREYADRNRYSKSEVLQNWVAGRIVKNFLNQTQLQPPESSLLEIGSGLGRVAKKASELGFAKYSAIEPNSILAAETRKASGSGSIVVEEYLPAIPNGFESSFDMVMSFHVLEHAPDQNSAREWVQSMERMVKPGGYILISGPDIRDYKSSFWDSDWSHGYPLTPGRVSQIYADLGLELVFATSLHFGSYRLLPRIIAHTLSAIIPTRVIDSACVKLFGRPLASGTQIALIWGITFVVAKKLD